jgi:hypothetical protein
MSGGRAPAQKGSLGILNLFRRRNPARELALLGIEKRRRSVCEVAAQIRDELGLPPSPALSQRRGA